MKCLKALNYRDVALIGDEKPPQSIIFEYLESFIFADSCSSFSRKATEMRGGMN